MKALFLMCLAAFAAVSEAGAQSIQTLHTFAGQPTDGFGPQSTLIKATDGNLWGTTGIGGANNTGTIYKYILPSGPYSIVYTFSALQTSEESLQEFNTDGSNAHASLVEANDSNLYGVAAGGGANGTGTIFEITLDGQFSTVYNFAAYDGEGGAQPTPNPDGAGPFAQLCLGSDGNLYGTTRDGGATGYGTVFQFNPSTHQLVTLHSFSAPAELTPTNPDGLAPESGVVQVGDYFYGTTPNGGTGGSGTVYKVDANSDFAVVYTFSAYDSHQHNSDGWSSEANLIVGPDGGLYGTTVNGGLYGDGTVFEVTTAGAFTVLHTFSAVSGPYEQRGTNGDGAVPYSPLVLGSDGNFYGTAAGGGVNAYGTVFQIAAGGVFNTLHSFGTLDANGDNTDGEYPSAGLLEVSPGVFYSTTDSTGPQSDGASAYGTLFELDALAKAPVITSPATASGTAQTAFSYQITATNQPASFGAQNLPAGLTLNSTSGLISGTLGSVAGVDQVTLSATNSIGTGTAILTLTVNPPEVNAPVINSALSASGQTGQAFSYQITATNQPTSFAAPNLPTGLTLDASTGLISGTLGTAAGAFPVTISATNSGGTGTAVLTLTVTAPPVNPPVISSATSASGQVGQAFTYQIAASNTPTSYSAANLPSGLTADGTTGLISGTPAQAGTFSVMLSAANSGGAGTATLNLTIAPAPPAVSIAATTPEVTLGSGGAGVFTVTLSTAQTVELSVDYTIKGTAINGVDYVLVTGKKKFNPGITSKKIRIEPLGDLEGAAKKTVKITLSAGSGYTLGAMTSAKVKILAGP